MAQELAKVIPGDLITANLINNILDELKSLQGRVAVLESDGTGSGAVVITDLIPPSGTVRVGEELQVLGKNFGFFVGAHRVHVDDVRIDTFKQGSSDQKLIFDIPLTIINVPSSGRPALLTVGNQSSTAQRTLTLQPGLILAGAVDVVPRGVQPGTLTPNTPATFEFLLRSRTNLNATYAIDPQISVAANQQDWQSRVQVLASNLSEITLRQIPLAAGQEIPFFVRMNPVPPNTDGTTFTLTVNVTAANVQGSSGPQTITVGSPAEQPDNTITLNFSSAEVNPAGTGGSVTANLIRLAQNAAAKVALAATFQVVGNYIVSPSLVGGAANWEVIRLLSTPSPYPITAQDLANPQGIAAKTLEFSIRPLPNATAGDVEFRVLRDGATQSRSFRMRLEQLA